MIRNFSDIRKRNTLLNSRSLNLDFMSIAKFDDTFSKNINDISAIADKKIRVIQAKRSAVRSVIEELALKFHDMGVQCTSMMPAPGLENYLHADELDCGTDTPLTSFFHAVGSEGETYEIFIGIRFVEESSDEFDYDIGLLRMKDGVTDTYAFDTGEWISTDDAVKNKLPENLEEEFINGNVIARC